VNDSKDERIQETGNESCDTYRTAKPEMNRQITGPAI
jgi:hypothetical protein